MRKKYQIIKDYKNVKSGEEVHDGSMVYRFRAGAIPHVRKSRGGNGYFTVQQHHQQFREFSDSRTLRRRLEMWEVDYDPVRRKWAGIDPWDNERWRGPAKNWKSQRRTRYRHPSINRWIHSPAYWI